MKKYTIIPLLAIMCFTACIVKQKSTVSNITITDKEWVATHLGEVAIELAEERLPTLILSEGKATGYSACNRFHGAYTLSGDNLSFNPLAGTKMFCQDAQQIEDNFLKALSNVKSWKYTNEKLYFLGENKEVLVVFRIKG